MRYTFVQRSGFWNTRYSVGNKKNDYKNHDGLSPPRIIFHEGGHEILSPRILYHMTFYPGGIIVATDVPGGYNVISPRITSWGDFFYASPEEDNTELE